MQQLQIEHTPYSKWLFKMDLLPYEILVDNDLCNLNT